MYKLKKIAISLLLVMVMLVVCCPPVMATDTVAGTSVDTPIAVVDENGNTVDTEEGSYIEIPIITVDENSSNENSNNENSNNGDITPYANSITNVDPFVIRSGNSTTCQLYLFWESTGEMWQSFRWNQLKVIGTSSINQKTYATIGQKTVKGAAGTVGTVLVKEDVSIPTNVSKVKVVTSGFQGYRVTPNPGWLSFTELNDKATIN